MSHLSYNQASANINLVSTYSFFSSLIIITSHHHHRYHHHHYMELLRYELVQSGTAPVVRFAAHNLSSWPSRPSWPSWSTYHILLSDHLPDHPDHPRRGNQMSVSVSWRGRAFDQKSDRVKLIFETGQVFFTFSNREVLTCFLVL